jgi:ankyrin repeat protein
LQVIKKTLDRTKRDPGERELAQDFMRDEEEKMRRELVIKRTHDLEALEKGTTTLGGKKLYFMRYRAARNRVKVDAILYLYFPENYRKLQAFYVFFASEAYLKGPYQPDLAKIQPLIASFKASDQVVAAPAAIGDLLKAAGKDDISRVKHLLDQGLDVNAKNKNGWSALMVAASRGKVEMLNLLLEKGAAVDAKNDQGQTPLIFAAHWGHANVVRRLIEQGANVNLQMNDGWTALIDSISMERTAAAKLLITSGADMNLKAKNGWTALMAAAYTNNVEIVNLMIENGADVNARDDMARTALAVAKMRGHQAVVNLLRQPNVRE